MDIFVILKLIFDCLIESKSRLDDKYDIKGLLEDCIVSRKLASVMCLLYSFSKSSILMFSPLGSEILLKITEFLERI